MLIIFQTQFQKENVLRHKVTFLEQKLNMNWAGGRKILAMSDVKSWVGKSFSSLAESEKVFCSRWIQLHGAAFACTMLLLRVLMYLRHFPSLSFLFIFFMFTCQSEEWNFRCETVVNKIFLCCLCVAQLIEIAWIHHFPMCWFRFSTLKYLCVPIWIIIFPLIFF